MEVMLFDGVAYGMLLFLVSVGLSVTLGLMRFVNLAHGAFAMIGGYALVVSMNRFGLSFWGGLVVAFVAAGLAGAVLERLLFRRLYGAGALDQVLLSIGVVYVLIAGATWWFGPGVQSVALPAYLDGNATVAGLTLSRYRLFLIAAALLVTLVSGWVVARTRYGAQVRAAVDRRHTAGALGVHVDRLFLATFSAGSALAGLGGALGINLLDLDPAFALKYLVYFLLVVCVGGAGTLSGPFVAALLVGVVDVLGKYYLPSLGAFLIYLLMVAMLIVRPAGLIPRRGAA